MPVIEVPGQGNVEFPDTMSDEEIGKVISQNQPKPSLGDKLEETISPTGGEDNFVTSPHGLIRTGLRQAVHGAREVFTPGQRAQGASDVIRGGMRMATPVAIPFAVANPVAAGLGVATGAVGGTAAKMGTALAGGDEGAQNLAEDIGGLAAGGYGVRKGTDVFPTARSLKELGGMVKGGARGAYEGATKMLPISRYGHHMDVPAPIAGAAAGEFAGWMSRLPKAPTIGAVIGSALPIVKGGFEGARQGILEARPPWVNPSISEGTYKPPVNTSKIKVSRPPGSSESTVSGPSVPTPEPAYEVPPIQEGTYKPPVNTSKIKVSKPYGKTAPQQIFEPPTEEAPYVNPTITPGTYKPPFVDTSKIKIQRPPNRVAPQAVYKAPEDPYIRQEDGQPLMKKDTKAPSDVMVKSPDQLQEPKLKVEASGTKEQTLEVKHPNHPAHAKIDMGIENKVPNVLAHAKAEGYTLESLKALQEDILQADDPARQAAGMEELKQLGKGAFTRAKMEGRPTNPTESKYKGMSPYVLQKVIEAWSK